MRDTAPASDWFLMTSRAGIRVTVNPVRSFKSAKYWLSILRTICRVPPAGPSKLSLRTGWDATIKRPSVLSMIPNVPATVVLSPAELRPRVSFTSDGGTGILARELKL